MYIFYFIITIVYMLYKYKNHYSNHYYEINIKNIYIRIYKTLQLNEASTKIYENMLYIICTIKFKKIYIVLYSNNLCYQCRCY